MYYTRSAQSAQAPEFLQNLQNLLLVNILPRETLSLDGEPQWDFTQIVLPPNSSIQAIIAAVEEEFKAEFARLDLRSAGALRAKLLGSAIDYDEAVLIDTEIECERLREDFKQILETLNA